MRAPDVDQIDTCPPGAAVNFQRSGGGVVLAKDSHATKTWHTEPVHPNGQFPGHFVGHTPSCLHVLLRVMRPLCSLGGGGGGGSGPLGYVGYPPPTPNPRRRRLRPQVRLWQYPSFWGAGMQRRKLVSRVGRRGKRDCVQCLRLLTTGRVLWSDWARCGWAPWPPLPSPNMHPLHVHESTAAVRARSPRVTVLPGGLGRVRARGGGGGGGRLTAPGGSAGAHWAAPYHRANLLYVSARRPCSVGRPPAYPPSRLLLLHVALCSCVWLGMAIHGPGGRKGRALCSLVAEVVAPAPAVSRGLPGSPRLSITSMREGGGLGDGHTRKLRPRTPL